MDYAILKSHSAEELETRVKEYLAVGYELAGGIAVASESSDCRYQNYFCQAVLKKDSSVDTGPTPPRPDLGSGGSTETSTVATLNYM